MFWPSIDIIGKHPFVLRMLNGILMVLLCGLLSNDLRHQLKFKKSNDTVLSGAQLKGEFVFKQ